MRRSVRVLWPGALGVVLATAALLSLVWPGPLALDDRVPLAVLFGIPAAIFLGRVLATLR